MDCDDSDILERIRSAKASANTSAEREKLAAAERLVMYSQSYSKMNRFKVGDLVTWKQGMRNRKCPRYDQVVIVSAVFDFVSVAPEKSSGSPYFREPQTMKIAFVDEDGEFVEFCVDGQRFEHMAEEDCVPKQVKMLRERLQTLLTSPAEPLRVGDRVYWKPHMKHKKRPNNEPAIVMEVLEQPILDEDKPGSQYWHEPLNVKIAMLDTDKEFVAYYFDSRRFCKIADDDDVFGDSDDSDSERDSSDVD